MQTNLDPRPRPLHHPDNTVLEDAAIRVDYTAEEEYGPPEESHEQLARLWSALILPKLKQPLDPQDPAILLAAMKLLRQSRRKKRDNLVDLAGYARVMERIG